MEDLLPLCIPHVSVDKTLETEGGDGNTDNTGVGFSLRKVATRGELLFLSEQGHNVSFLFSSPGRTQSQRIVENGLLVRSVIMVC